MRIAYFSPLNPKPSGISDYSEALLPHLAGSVKQVDVFIEDYTPSARFTLPNLRIRPWQEFEPAYRAGNYDGVLYHLGNNEFHIYIYDLALRIPGVVVLHEFNLHYLVAHATLVRQDWEGYFREVEYDAGTAALERARQAQAGLQQPDYDGVALSRRLLGCSQAAIVHSEYMVRRVREAGHRLPLRRIPHGVDVPVVDGAAARQYLAERTGFPLDGSARVFGIFGFLKPYKRIYGALRAFARLRKEHPEVRMVLVGEEHPHYPLRPLIRELGLEDIVRILGHVPIETFTKLLAATDYCINLRRPTAGETSGSFLRALALGKPTLVSEIGSFLELPDDVAFKIPVDEKEVEWLYEYMKTLLEDPKLALAVGECGRAYVERECLWPRVADLYYEFLEECARSRREPAAGDARGAGAVSQEQLRPPALSVEALQDGPLPYGRRSTVAHGPELLSKGGSDGVQQTQPSAEELQEYIVGFSHGSKLMEEYVQTHLARLVRTIQITPAGGNGDRALELGCYLQITPALHQYLGYGEVRGAYYGEAGKTDVRSTTSITGETFSCTMDLFDAERDPFPYPDGYFRAVLCGELIEHLTTDPMHMLAEINRIVAEDGYLILTTPNIAGLRSLHAVLNGYHPALFPSYIRPSGDGTVDPRHSREYTPIEVAQLVEAAGFHVEHLETGDYNERGPNYEEARRVLEANRLSTALRGEVIFCRARKMGPLRHRWPKELYYPP